MVFDLVFSLSPLSAIDYDRFFTAIPTSQALQKERIVAYIDYQPAKSGKVFMIPENDNIKIYHAKRYESSVEECETNWLDTLLGEEYEIISTPSFEVIQKPNKDSIIRKCKTKKKYIPLKHRTKTLFNLKQGDPIDIRKSASNYENRLSKRFEKKRKKVKAKHFKNNNYHNSYDDDFIFE